MTFTDQGYFQSLFLSVGIDNFEDSLEIVQELMYSRNVDKNNLACVIEEGRGTCSTKHSLIKRLAEELQLKDFSLKMVMFKMHAGNTAKIANTLVRNKLLYIPEAHNYIRYQNKVLDITFPKNMPQPKLTNDILEEIEVNADQTGAYKVQYHQDYLKKWLRDENMEMSFDKLWKIREECILALSS